MAMRETLPPLTLDQAAQYLNVSERKMRRLVAERRVPFHKIGRLLRFLVADLDDLLESGRVEPPRPLISSTRRGRLAGDSVPSRSTFLLWRKARRPHADPETVDR